MRAFPFLFLCMKTIACFHIDNVPETWLSENTPVSLIYFTKNYQRPGIFHENTSYGEKITVAYPPSQWKKEYPQRIDILFTNDSRLKRTLLLGQQTTLIIGLSSLIKNFVWEKKHCQKHRNKNVKLIHSSQKPQNFLVIGAGLAGAFLAHSLQSHGQKVTIVDAGMTIASQASALYAGLMHPHWQKQDHPLFSLTRHGYHWLKKLLRLYPDCFHRMGCLEIANSSLEEQSWKEAQEKNIPFSLPKHLLHYVTQQEAKTLSGLPIKHGGWFYPKSGLVKISTLCRKLLCNCTVLTNTTVSLRKNSLGQIQAFYQNQWHRFDHIICATAYQSLALLNMPYSLMPIDSLFGRISILATPQTPQPKTAITGSGYFSSLDGFYALGATYEKDIIMSPAQAHASNIQQFEHISSALQNHQFGGFYQGYRAVAKDRLPIVGPITLTEQLLNLSFAGVPEKHQIPTCSNLWICSAMGSRGITWGSILAENLVRQILNIPAILPKSIEKSLTPQRFLIQAYKKTNGKTIVSSMP